MVSSLASSCYHVSENGGILNCIPTMIKAIGHLILGFYATEYQQLSECPQGRGMEIE